MGPNRRDQSIKEGGVVVVGGFFKSSLGIG